MIKAEELRIGNWIRAGEKFVRVESIYGSGINLNISSPQYEEEDWSEEYEAYFENIHPYNIPWIEPISLSPDILEKCGLRQSKGPYKMFWNGENDLSFRLDTKTGVLRYKISSTYYTEIKYLHELQNLYYAIIKRELSISF